VSAVGTAHVTQSSATDGGGLLRLDRVSRHFGKLQAVQDVSFAMNEGELRALIGPNGAGKTTFFNLITGFVPPTSGDIWFDAENIRDRSVVYRVHRGIVRTFQITEVFPDLSVSENVRIGVETAAKLNGRPWITRQLRHDVERRVDELLDVVGLANKADRTVGELAHGDQRVVEIALALTMNPRLLMLDELLTDTAATETDHMVDLVSRLHAERNLSILFIEHDMSIVFGIAQKITVLDQGRVLAEGSAADISANEQVRAAYLGETV
jgi:branched-chain amino acid transport system ATP-binding protein